MRYNDILVLRFHTLGRIGGAQIKMIQHNHHDDSSKRFLVIGVICESGSMAH